MTPETLISFPFPEIIRNSEFPPMYSDLDVNEPELVRLLHHLSGHHNHKEPYLRQIEIIGGILLEPVDQGLEDTDASRPISPNQEELSAVVDDIYCDKQKEAIFGRYHAKSQRVLLYSDTMTLMSIVSASSYIEREGILIQEEQLAQVLKDTIWLQVSQALSHELIHSFQEGLQIMHGRLDSIPPTLLDSSKHHYHLRALKLEKLPEVKQLSMQSISPEFLLSDDQILELYDIVRDRYRIFNS